MGPKSKIMLSFALLSLMLAMILWPAESVEAAQAALSLWWRMILPSLLPFFISAELLIRLGLLPKLSRLLTPLMWPIFRLPGAAALAVLLGYSTGFPGGAAITAGLRQSGQINKEQGERLICFTNNASPLYISVALAAGLLGQPRLGGILMLIHYGSNLLIGFLLRFRAAKEPLSQPDRAYGAELSPATANSLLEQISIGNLLKKAATVSFGNISLIGCYMTFFAVLLAMLKEGGILFFLLRPLYALGVPAGAASALAAGLWEMSLGVEQAAQAGLPLTVSLPVIAAILGWGGFSVQAQVAAMVADTDIQARTYFFTRIAHALISFGLTSLWCSRASISVSTLVLGYTGLTTALAWKYSLLLCLGAYIGLAALCCLGGLIGLILRSRKASSWENYADPRGYF